MKKQRLMSVWFRSSASDGDSKRRKRTRSSSRCRSTLWERWVPRILTQKPPWCPEPSKLLLTPSTTDDPSHTQLPLGSTLAEAVTLPDNFVTVFHAAVTDLGLDLPWPKPASYKPPRADDPILIWGGASSVGQYALQVLQHYGYRNLLATASARNHAALRALGAAHVFDYRDPDVAAAILAAAAGGRADGPTVSLVFDCIGSKDGSLAPLAKIAQDGSTVAVLLPIILVDAADNTAPVYAMDVEKEAAWAKGVTVRGVRTHFYLEVRNDRPGACVNQWLE